MKTVKIAATLLFLLVSAILVNSFYIGRVTKELSKELEAVDDGDLDAAAKEYERIFEKFKKVEKIISLSVSHDDLTNIEEGFAEIIGAAKAGGAVGLITVKSRLRDSLEHLGRLSGINLDSIL